MNAFQQARGNNVGQMNQLSLKANSLQATIARLLEIGINHTDAAERKQAEVSCLTSQILKREDQVLDNVRKKF